MILHIKFMVSLRCKMAVKDALDKMGLHYNHVVLGEVDLINDSIIQYQRSTGQQKDLRRIGKGISVSYPFIIGRYFYS